MGDTKPTTRTLKSGEKVTHYPDGRQVLQPAEESHLGKFFDEAGDTHRWLNAEKQYYDTEAVREKIGRMDDGDRVPNDKRPV